MQRQVANYTVIIEKQRRLGTKQWCYAASVPILGIGTEADTIEQVEKEITALIQFHLDSLVTEGKEVPVEKSQSLITRSEVYLPKGAVLMQ